MNGSFSGFFRDIFPAHYFIATGVTGKVAGGNLNICTAATICNLFTT